MATISSSGQYFARREASSAARFGSSSAIRAVGISADRNAQSRGDAPRGVECLDAGSNARGGGRSVEQRTAAWTGRIAGGRTALRTVDTAHRAGIVHDRQAPRLAVQAVEPRPDVRQPDASMQILAMAEPHAGVDHA